MCDVSLCVCVIACVVSVSVLLAFIVCVCDVSVYGMCWFKARSGFANSAERPAQC